MIECRLTGNFDWERESAILFVVAGNLHPDMSEAHWESTIIHIFDELVELLWGDIQVCI